MMKRSNGGSIGRLKSYVDTLLDYDNVRPTGHGYVHRPYLISWSRTPHRRSLRLDPMVIDTRHRPNP